MRILVLFLTSLVTMAMVLGCSDDDDSGSVPHGGEVSGGGSSGGEVMSIAEALTAAPAEVTVDGYVIETGGEVLLAETLAESFPPQPGGAVLVLNGVDPNDLEGSNQQGDTIWVDRRYRVSGSIEGEILAVTTLERSG